MAEVNQISWRSPSNIAIVKYWGKTEIQIPMNPSLSFTLNQCCTETKINYQSGSGSIKFLYDGKEKIEFLPKIEKFFSLLQLDFLKELDLIIDSKNNFPHSAGIASSASAMSALSLCITELEQKNYNPDIDFLQLSSIRSRLGSGSACRSIFPKAAIWGSVNHYAETSDQYAVDWSSNLHSEFDHVQDWIFLVSQSEKAVSSSAGHNLMNNHPFKQSRINQANKNITQLIKVLKTGDWESFISISEEEALSLHALMMSSNPGYILLEPESIALIRSIQELRTQQKIPVCYTIDAGPNIHLLFPKKIESEISNWLNSEWRNYLTNNKIIKDQMGLGPVRI